MCKAELRPEQVERRTSHPCREVRVDFGRRDKNGSTDKMWLLSMNCASMRSELEDEIEDHVGRGIKWPELI